MDVGVHFLKTSTAHDEFFVKSSYLQTIDPIPDFLAAHVRYVQVPIFTGYYIRWRVSSDCTATNCFQSDWQSIQRGVPQGSVQGPMTNNQ
jgi:hypothetical protein